VVLLRHFLVACATPASPRKHLLPASALATVLSGGYYSVLVGQDNNDDVSTSRRHVQGAGAGGGKAGSDALGRLEASIWAGNEEKDQAARKGVHTPTCAMDRCGVWGCRLLKGLLCQPERCREPLAMGSASLRCLPGGGGGA